MKSQSVRNMPYFLRSKDLKEQLERALNEMQELRSARDRQAAMVCYIILFIMHRIQKTGKILPFIKHKICTFIFTVAK